MALVPMSQTKEFSSATLESEKGFIVFSEEKKKEGEGGSRGRSRSRSRSRRRKSYWNMRDGRRFEAISLYAVHKVRIGK